MIVVNTLKGTEDPESKEMFQALRDIVAREKHEKRVAAKRKETRKRISELQFVSEDEIERLDDAAPDGKKFAKQREKNNRWKASTPKWKREMTASQLNRYLISLRYMQTEEYEEEWSDHIESLALAPKKDQADES